MLYITHSFHYFISDDLCSRHDFHNFKESVKLFKSVTINVYFYLLPMKLTMSIFKVFLKNLNIRAGRWSVDNVKGSLYRCEGVCVGLFLSFCFPLLELKWQDEKQKDVKLKIFLECRSTCSFLTCPHQRFSYILVYQRRLRT